MIDPKEINEQYAINRLMFEVIDAHLPAIFDGCLAADDDLEHAVNLMLDRIVEHAEARGLPRKVLRELLAAWEEIAAE